MVKKVENLVVNGELNSFKIHVRRPLTTGDVLDYDFTQSASTNIYYKFEIPHGSTGALGNTRVITFEPESTIQLENPPVVFPPTVFPPVLDFPNDPVTPIVPQKDHGIMQSTPLLAIFVAAATFCMNFMI